MLYVRGLLVLSFGLVVCGEDPPATTNDFATTIDEHPYVVSLQYDGRHVCAGSILNENWILTAGHCVFNRLAKDFRVVAASSKLTTPGVTYGVQKLVIHENYTDIVEEMFYAVNNIALVRVDPMTFSSGCKPIALPRDDVQDYDQIARFVGWGSEGCSDVDQLHSSEVNLATPRYSVKLFHHYVDLQAHICVFRVVGDQPKICPCDDGGPLVLNDVIVGVALKLDYCSTYRIPFTRVWHYKEWIEGVISEPPHPTTTTTTERPVKKIKYDFR